MGAHQGPGVAPAARGGGVAKNGIIEVLRPARYCQHDSQHETTPGASIPLVVARAFHEARGHGFIARRTMIYSMTGYASATRELVAASGTGGASVSVELRTVNSRFLDLNFRMPEDVRVCEPTLREMLMTKLSRGKVDIRINIQRSEQAASAGALNRDALEQLATLERAVLEAFPESGRLRTGEILRWPGVLAESGVAPEVLRDAVLGCGKQAIADLIDVRAREGAQLANVLLANVTEMESIVAKITPLVPDLIVKHQQKIVERLQEALGIAAPESANGNGTIGNVTREEISERIRQEVTMYGIRIDIAEELSRLTAHLGETRHVIEKGGRVGKRLDFMMQELNREANTLGSKAAAKELADASMTLKLLIEQMREQVQNLE
ncbi:YicC family protein [Paraburkholderia sacchari]